MSIILIGYRGSGKTTVGRLLAQKLSHPFVDVDDLIVASAGKSIKDIFADHGESHFRELETQSVLKASHLQNHVIALGGGALVRPANREAIQKSGHRVIYLKCDDRVLLDRIRGDVSTAKNRPNLTALGGGIDEVRKIMSEREPTYRALMTSELDVTNLTPEEASLYIVRWKSDSSGSILVPSPGNPGEG